ncbi:hypothetical protein [Shimia sp. MIT1388]|uniref:hypothetical protein n=1 Tax=Shimia sp. MIT1388 TaxID=3096992 RepID=UPI00399A8FC5
MSSHLSLKCVWQDYWAGLNRDLSFLQRLGVIIVFFGVPILAATTSYWCQLKLPKEQFSSLVSVYAIFSALLFGAQVSAFTIFKGIKDQQVESLDPNEPDEVLKENRKSVAEERVKDLRLAFRDINSNISYLILNSILLLSIVLVLVLFGKANVFSTSVIVGLTVHLILTLAMVVKHCHLVFSAAYAEI